MANSGLQNEGRNSGECSRDARMNDCFSCNKLLSSKLGQAEVGGRHKNEPHKKTKKRQGMGRLWQCAEYSIQNVWSKHKVTGARNAFICVCCEGYQKFGNGYLVLK